MSILSALSGKTRDFEEAFGVKDITTQAMQNAILDWYGLYYDREPTKEEDPCQRLPVAIVSKLTKTAFSEYTATVSGAKKEYLSEICSALDRCRKRAMQSALVGGECLLKPVFSPLGLCFSVIGRKNYLVLGRNELDEITDVGTEEKTTVGRLRYTLLERRSVDDRGYLTIESRLYRSDSDGVLGIQVPLGTLEKYALLSPVNVLPAPVRSIGLVPLRTSLENCVDGSPDGVSVYAAAVSLIHNINRNEAQINGEFERGRSRLIVSSDMMERGVDGKKRLTDDVFTAVDASPEDVGIAIFSPALREQSYLARKAEYLRNCETVIGLKRGILSEVEAAERTATEITSSAGDYNLTIADLQEMWAGAVREAVRVCDILGQMYKVCGGAAVDPDKDVSIDWGDGVLFNRDKVWEEQRSMVAAGLLDPAIALAWYYGLPFPATEQDREKIRNTYMPETEKMLGGGE